MVGGSARRGPGFARRGIRLWRVRRAGVWGKAARTEDARPSRAALVLVGGWHCDCRCARFVMVALGRAAWHQLLTSVELPSSAALERGVQAASTFEWKRAGANLDLVGGRKLKRRERRAPMNTARRVNWLRAASIIALAMMLAGVR